MTRLKYVFVPIALFCSALFSITPAYAGFDETMYNTSRSIESFTNAAGEMVVGGGIVVAAVIALIVTIATVFTLIMMMKR